MFLFSILCFSQVKDSAMVEKNQDSTELVKKMKELQVKNKEIKDLLAESKKLNKNTETLLKKVTFYVRRVFVSTNNSNRINNNSSDIKGLKPEEYNPLREEKVSLEQKPKSIFGRIIYSLFGKKNKTAVTDSVK